MKTIGIIGSRSRDCYRDFDECEEVFFSVYEDGDEIVSGGCPKGGDRFAEKLAKTHQVPIKIYYAQWDKHGKAAGFIRNSQIANDADVIIAVVSENRKSGTYDTIKKAEKDGKKIHLVPKPLPVSNKNFDPFELT